MKTSTTALRFVFIGLSFCFVGHLAAQNILTEMDHDAHHTYDRMMILSGGGDSSLHSAIQPYWRHDLVVLADSFSQYREDKISSHQVQSIYDQNNEFINPQSYLFIHHADSASSFPYRHGGGSRSARASH